ncbi:hypothetical protein [Photobacterium sp. GB-210]|uniref:hypothetical protein n=1 Tax=Photobacterium sp. GB-210 TaxID=2022104 RepID=UPI001E58CC46|nr:hypothetical protein [Photobacterium sp. GB-210]
MNRRSFLEILITTFAASKLYGCSGDTVVPQIKHKDINIPKFSTEVLHNSLDKLLKAFEAKGMKVSESLLPPLDEQELREKCSWFPGDLTEEIIALYSWRGGQVNDAWGSEYPFWFRDNSFCSIERAKNEYKSMMDSYGTYKEDHFMLKNSFPIASFNGGWYVIPTKGNNLSSVLERPIISVMQGIDVYFYSIQKMVDTCVEWVENDKYKEDGLYPEELEMEIWSKHNPGIFS